jgi:Ca-activated chloride channel family protein
MRLRFALSTCALLLGWACASLAQDSLPSRRPPMPQPPMPPPVVWIPPAQNLQPIRLDSVNVRIDSQGPLARTRIELSFHNPNPRVLEGELVFPLGAGLTVSGYALEVEGQMREGVVVPKQTARVAFEDISRQQIDPGLAEITQGNVFRTRLYPIPAQGNKRVAISFEQLMPLEAGHFRYLLPLSFTQVVKRFEVQVEARDTGGVAAIASPDPALSFDRAGPAWTAGFVRENVQPQKELAFAIPAGDGARAQVEAADQLEPAWRSVLAQLDSGLAQTSANAAAPKRIALFFDASASASGRDLERERALLRSYLAELDGAEVLLIPFRDVTDRMQRFRIGKGEVDALLNALAALPLDGGSSYGAIDLANLPAVDRVLILGDGLQTFGSHQPQLTGAGQSRPPVYALHAAQRADRAALERITRAGGGQLIDLLELDTAAALAALRAPAWRLQSVNVTAGRCGTLLPVAGESVPARLLLSGRCEGAARIEMVFGNGDASVTRAVEVGSQPLAEGALADSVRRLQAQAQIQQLLAAATPDEAAISALATRFGVVTPYTSLLVLDRIEDYVRYRIAPKEPELRAAYERLLATQPKLAVPEDSGRAARLQNLQQLWSEFSAWHKQRHPWLETLLQPAASSEAAAWAQVPASALDAKTLRARIEASRRLQSEVDALIKRWPNEGADAMRRPQWEREAIARMLELDALKRAREALGEAAAAPGTPVAVGAAERESLERAEVTGSRARQDNAPRVAEAMAAPMAPAPAASAIAGGAAPRERPGEPAAPPSPTLTASISLKGWNPDTPYLKAIRAAADPYAEYLKQRESNREAPAFYLDVADHFREVAKQTALAQRILSNLAELAPENTALVRVLGHRLAQWEQVELAAIQFEAALKQRGEEPQSYRDLALVLARQPQPDYARAIDLLWQVAIRDWHGRFPEIELIAAHELNDLIARAGRATVEPTLKSLGIPDSLIDSFPVGLRVVMSWDADNTDIDLWVIDPLGVAVYYGANRSSSGGRVTRDFTQGYGPEVFTITRPIPGTYRVQAHYFGDRRQSLSGPVTVQLEFQTDHGTVASARQAVTRRLEDGKQRIDVGEFTVGAAPQG